MVGLAASHGWLAQVQARVVWLQAHHAETQQVKQSVALGMPEHLSANAPVDCALVHTLRNSVTGISDVSGSPVMASGMDSSATGVGVIGASLDADGPSYWGSKDAPGRQRSKYVWSSVSRRESWPRKLFFHFRKSNVISNCLDNSMAMTNPYVCKNFVPNDNPWTQPTHRPLTLSLVVPTPIHDLVSDCKTNL